MIECWFSESGFAICSSQITSRLYLDPGRDHYVARWYCFGQMMTELLAGGPIQCPVIINHDARLVEELQGDLEPLTDYGKECRQYYMIHDRPMMRSVTINKVSSAQINIAIRETGEQTRS